jgi:hypothetical protein
MVHTTLPDDAQEPGLENTVHPTGGAEQADEQPAPSAPDVVPLFEIIDEFVAQHPVLQEVTTPRETRWCVVSNGEHRVDRDLDFMYWRMQSGTADLLQQIDELDPQDHAALVIEDVDAELYHKLFARYSTSLDAEFLAQHVLRLADLRGTHDIDHACIPELYHAFFELMTDVRAMLS